MVEKRQSRFFYGYIVVAAAFGIWITIWGMSQTYGVFFKPMLSEFGWTRAMTAGTRSVSAGVTGLLTIVAGRLTDRIGPRKVILLFGCFAGLGFLLMSQISTLWQFYLVYGLVIGIGFSAATIPTLTTVARWFVKRRGLMAGIVQSGGGIGGTVFTLLTGWLIITQDWRSAYFILGIMALALIILSALFIRRDPGQIGQLPYGADETAGLSLKGDSLGPRAEGLSIREAIHTQQFWIILIMLFGFGFCRSATLVHIVAHVNDLGFSLLTGANILAIISGTSIIGRLGTGRLIDIIGSRRSYLIGFSIIAAGLLWVMATDELWTLYLFAVAFGFGWGALAVVRMPMTAEVFGLGSLGTILGTLEGGSYIGAITGPLLFGWIFDVTGVYTVAFLIAAVVAIIGLVLTVLLRPIGAEGKGPR